jgi:hypothetical protein
LKIKRKHLAWIKQALGIKNRPHPHLLSQIGLIELVTHEIALLDSDAVLASQAPADLDTEL